jgi:protein-tyrosine phosphatase
LHEKNGIIKSASRLDAVEVESIAPETRPVSSRGILFVKIVVVAVFVMAAAECLRVFVGSNFHAVVPGHCYRSAQPTPAFMEQLHRTHDIHAIINLRDENKDQIWYQCEIETAARLNVTVFNAGLSSYEHPPAVDFRRFMRAVKEAPEPVLIHCANGNDRTGFASAVYLLLRTNTTIADARQQLSVRYGHFWWRRAALDRILGNYESWLSIAGKSHTPDNFYDWGLNVYQPEWALNTPR